MAMVMPPRDAAGEGLWGAALRLKAAAVPSGALGKRQHPTQRVRAPDHIAVQQEHLGRGVNSNASLCASEWWKRGGGWVKPLHWQQRHRAERARVAVAAAVAHRWPATGPCEFRPLRASLPARHVRLPPALQRRGSPARALRANEKATRCRLSPLLQCSSQGQRGKPRRDAERTILRGETTRHVRRCW